MAVGQALLIGTQLRWVNGEAQLADALTKGGLAKKMLMQFFANDQRWQLVHDPDFVAGKKLKKRSLETQLKDKQTAFFNWIQRLAVENRWPWIHADSQHELRIMGDDLIQKTWQDRYS